MLPPIVSLEKTPPTPPPATPTRKRNKRLIALVMFTGTVVVVLVAFWIAAISSAVRQQREREAERASATPNPLRAYKPPGYRAPVTPSAHDKLVEAQDLIRQGGNFDTALIRLSEIPSDAPEYKEAQRLILVAKSGRTAEERKRAQEKAQHP